MINNCKVCACLLCAFFTAQTILGQEKTAPANPRPSPQISGTLIGSDGIRKIILEYKRGAQSGTFIGNLQSTCAIPGKTDSGSPTPFALSEIPPRSKLTLFYVRHTVDLGRGKRTENFILAIRFDNPKGISGVAKGQIIRCYQQAQPPVPNR